MPLHNCLRAKDAVISPVTVCMLTAATTTGSPGKLPRVSTLEKTVQKQAGSGEGEEAMKMECLNSGQGKRHVEMVVMSSHEVGHAIVSLAESACHLVERACACQKGRG